MASIALDAAEKRADALTGSLLKLALATREYAPRVHAARSLGARAPTCPGGDAAATRAVVSVAGREDLVACAPDDVAAVLEKAEAPVRAEGACADATPLLGSEAPYPSGAKDGAPTLQLVADYASPDFRKWHAACVDAAADRATYVLRHAPAATGLRNDTYRRGVP